MLLCHHRPVINNDCSSSWHPLFKPPKPVSISKRSSLLLKGVAAQRRFSGDDMREQIRKQSRCEALCVFARSWTSPGFSLTLFLHSTYLPETPFPGRWPSQFASSLNKHFTGERLDLHLPIARPPHADTHARTHTHTHNSAHNYTHRHDRLKLALMLTTKISFSHTQMRQTSCHIWVTRLTVD